MSAQLPDDTSGAAHPPSRPESFGQAAPEPLLRRIATRIAWRDEPLVRLTFRPADDALIVDVLPLPPARDRVVADLLAVEFDGTDVEALPVALCLTGVRARPDSVAAACARYLLGEPLWAQARSLIISGGLEREVRLDAVDRDARIRVWRRLVGLAIGVEVQPRALQAALVDTAGEVIASTRCELADMEPGTVLDGIARISEEFRDKWGEMMLVAPLLLGVQIPGPVHPTTGVVHYFHKRSRTTRSSWAWDEVPFEDMLRDELGIPAVKVMNDVSGYATYERWFHPSPAEDCRAVILISQGIGAKLLINGEVSTRMPMEIGNMVLHEGGRECDCGGRGCLEASAGTLAIIEHVSWVTGLDVVDIAHAVAAAEPGDGDVDHKALDVFRQAGRDLARGIGHVQAIANPSSWALYGPRALLDPGSAAGAEFLDHLLEYDEWVSYDPYRNCRVDRRPILGDEGPHGAALVVIERYMKARPPIAAKRPLSDTTANQSKPDPSSGNAETGPR